MRASIDIGSNTILLLVVDDTGKTVHDEAQVVGLGQGLGHQGIFKIDRMEKAAQVMAELAETAQSLGVAPGNIRAVATSAARRAMNARSFFAQIAQNTGVNIEIISGEREAQLTWHGAMVGMPVKRQLVSVVDLGGGSTEVVTGIPGDGPTHTPVSLEVGSIRLTESHFGADPNRYQPADFAKLRAEVTRVVDQLNWPTLPKALIAVAGTATTLCAMDLGLTEWDANKVHGSRLSRAALRRWIDRLLDSTPSERAIWAQVSPQRAPYLLAGACVLETIASAAHRESLWISDGGVRHGVMVLKDETAPD
jgi:exopolyphosphatase/guanosine-5'-triphosphate,3'-diphosphate pyrophosphatase